MSDDALGDRDGLAHAPGMTRLGRERLGHDDRDRDEPGCAEQRQHHEDATPRGHVDEQPPNSGRRDRRDAADQHQQREHARRRGALLTVANDRTCDDHGDATEEPLHEAKTDERRCGRRERAREAATA